MDDVPERAMEAAGMVETGNICRINKLIKTQDWSESGLIGTEATNILKMETWHKLYQKFHRTVQDDEHDLKNIILNKTEQENDDETTTRGEYVNEKEETISRVD